MERRTTKHGFWNGNREEVQKVTRRISSLRGEVDGWKELKDRYEDLEILRELAVTENDEPLLRELAEDIDSLISDLSEWEAKMLLGEDNDRSNAILSIHPGAGGTESQDWAQMLMRMYLRWAEEKKCRTEIIDYLPGDEAGIKSVTILISGDYAYGYLKAEKGVHRLVRLSPFDSANRRHTSFASVDVIPEIDEKIDVEIDEENLKIETFHATGAGGQHVNVTDSAVRITHIPTGIVVSCQNERSQYKNKAMAMKVLRARLYEKYREEQEKKLAKLRGEQKEIAWGSQIRSYVLHPYNMVKDHRTGAETSNTTAVLDGDIDEFIEAYLRWRVAS